MMNRRTMRNEHASRVPVIGGWFLLLMVLGLVLVACDTSSVCVGCVKTVLPGHVIYRYHRFNGRLTRDVNADPGETLVVDYEATVERGELIMQILDPDDEPVWEETYTEGQDVIDTVQVEMGQDGTYELMVKGDETRGRFEVEWEVN